MTDLRSCGTSRSRPIKMVMVNQLDIIVVDKQDKKAEGSSCSCHNPKCNMRKKEPEKLENTKG